MRANLPSLGFGEILKRLVVDAKDREVEEFVLRRLEYLREKNGLMAEDALDGVATGLRSKLRRAVTKDAILNAQLLAEVIGVLNFSADDFFPMRHPLLSLWPAGSRVEIFLGGHHATAIENVPPKVRLKAVGLGDALAFADLISFFQQRVDFRIRFGLNAVPAGLSFKAAQKEIDSCLRKKGVGAVISIGSDVANTASAALAEYIMRGAQNVRDLPKFHWDKSSVERLKKANIPEVISSLLPARQGEGLRCSSFYHRDRDNLPNTHMPLRDCGCLFFDVRTLPWKIVLAGHGSDGTQGAVHSLREQGAIHAKLDEKSGDGLGAGRGFLIVETERKDHQLRRRLLEDDAEWHVVNS